MRVCGIQDTGQELIPVTAAVGGFATAAVSGVMRKELDGLWNKAREMENRTKFSASEAVEAMNYMAMARRKIIRFFQLLASGRLYIPPCFGSCR